MSLALINIAITDVNDEIPKFGTTNYVVDLSESAKGGETVLRIQGTDADKDAKLEYSISCPCQVWDASGSIGSREDAEKYFSHLR